MNIARHRVIASFVLGLFSCTAFGAEVSIAESVPSRYLEAARLAKGVLENTLKESARIVEVFEGPSGFLGYVVEAGGSRMVLWQTPNRDMIVSGMLFDRKGRNLSKLAADAYGAQTPMDIALAKYDAFLKKELEEFFSRIKLAADALPSDAKEAFYQAYASALRQSLTQGAQGSSAGEALSGTSSTTSSGSVISPTVSVAEGCGTDRKRADMDGNAMPTVFVPLPSVAKASFVSALRDLSGKTQPIVLGSEKDVRVHVFADASCPYSRKLMAEVMGALRDRAQFFVHPVAIFTPEQKAAQIHQAKDASLLSGKPMFDNIEASKASLTAVQQNTEFLRKYVGYDATPFVVFEKDGKMWLMIGPKPELLSAMIEDKKGTFDIYAQVSKEK